MEPIKIDMHTHLLGAGPKSAGFISPKMRRSVPYQFLLHRMGLHKIKDPDKQDEGYVEQLKKSVDQSALDKAVLLAFDKVYSSNGAEDANRTALYVSNDYVRRVCEQCSGSFLFGASVNPLRKDALDELSKVKAQGAVLVKLLPNSQGFDPADPRLTNYYKHAASLQLPLLYHCGYEHTIPVIDQSLGDPLRLESALDLGATIIIAHGGSSGLFHFNETFGRTLALLKKYANCYFDNSAMTNVWRSKYLLWMLHPEVLHRKFGVELPTPFSQCLYGSDYPIPITPFAFAGRLGPKQLLPMGKIKNPFDLDMALKKQIGVPDICFENTTRVLQLPSYCT